MFKTDRGMVDRDSNANFKNLIRTLLTRSMTRYGRFPFGDGADGGHVFGTFSRKNLPRLAEDNWFTFFEASIRGNACESWCTAAKAQKVTPGGCWRWRSASTRLIKRPVKKNGFDIHLISESTLRKCLLLPLGAVAVKLC